ncbi:MAG TPA: ABC transporter ATP-binding protein [Methanomassiliicoccales archaeon]|nr:ABC transporter ATP-binding protein [Methanomassiliicoccales archaeon]
MAETVIEVKGLVKSYGELKAVNGIDLEVKAGEVYSILGPNGAGKTTSVEIMECLRVKTSGDVRILGHDIDKEQKEIRKRIGVLPQSFNAFDYLTVKENIDYFGGLFDRRLGVDELIESVQLQDKRNVWFMNLSGGLKQRVGVAISMVNDPELIFLDEPTTGLDPKARREVWDVIRKLKLRNKTVILTTHYMEEAEILSDRVAIMDQGGFIAMGTPRQIIDKYGSGSTCLVKSANDAARTLVASAGMSSEFKNGDLWVKLEDKGSLAKLVNLLSGSEVTYEEMLIKGSSLEDVFLKLTGKKLVEVSS